MWAAGPCRAEWPCRAAGPHSVVKKNATRRSTEKNADIGCKLALFSATAFSPFVFSLGKFYLAFVNTKNVLQLDLLVHFKEATT